jgi:hypothetical protein
VVVPQSSPTHSHTDLFGVGSSNGFSGGLGGRWTQFNPSAQSASVEHSWAGKQALPANVGSQTSPAAQSESSSQSSRSKSHPISPKHEAAKRLNPAA